MTFIRVNSIKPNKRDVYELQLDKYLINTKEFYKVGGTTFISRGNVIGSEKNVILSCFTFYLPKIAKIIYEKHKLGLGIFLMQGFER